MRRVSQALRERFPDHAEGFDQYEQIVQEWEDRFRKAEPIIRSEDRLLRRGGPNTARRLMAALLTNTAARIVNLGNGVVVLLNAQNAHSAPAVARALYETCGVVTYARRHVVPRLKKQRAAQVKERLFRLGLGSDPRLGGRLRPITVRALTKSLAQDWDELGAKAGEIGFEDTFDGFYAALSDDTHPNMPATHRSADITEGLEASWTLQPPVGLTELHGAFGFAYLAMWIAGRAWDEVFEAADRHPLVLPAGEEGFSEDAYYPAAADESGGASPAK